MQLLAAGFNAWSQLQFGDGDLAEDNEPGDITTFTKVLEGQAIDNLRPFLTFTTVELENRLLIAGDLPTATAGNRLDYYYAEALNGLVAAFDGNEPIHQYASLGDLQLRKPPSASFLGIPEVVQIVAYDTGFAALTALGQVLTWGDGRFPLSLGRDVSDESPADRPGRVTCLEGLPTGPIVKIAAGGHVLAALTEGNDLYCWGSYPGRSPVLGDLDGEPAPIVVVPYGAGDGDGEDNAGVDIVDVGLGEAHMIVLTADGHVCVVGSNANGQLGLGSDQQVAASWTKVDLRLGKGQRVVGVAAGPRSSFITVDT